MNDMHTMNPLPQDFLEAVTQGMTQGRAFADSVILPCMDQEGVLDQDKLQDSLFAQLDSGDHQQTCARVLLMLQCCGTLSQGDSPMSKELLRSLADASPEKLRWITELNTQGVEKLLARELPNMLGMVQGVTLPDPQTDLPGFLQAVLAVDGGSFWQEQPQMLGALLGISDCVQEGVLSRVVKEYQNLTPEQKRALALKYRDRILKGVAVVVLCVAVYYGGVTTGTLSLAKDIALYGAKAAVTVAKASLWVAEEMPLVIKAVALAVGAWNAGSVVKAVCQMQQEANSQKQTAAQYAAVRTNEYQQA